MNDQDRQIQRSADRLLQILGEYLEGMTPQDVDLRTVRSISSTLKDIRDLQAAKEDTAPAVTVTLEGEAERYAR